MLKYTYLSHMIQQGFKEYVYVHISIIIVLHYIILYAFVHKTKHLNIILLRYIIGRYRVATGMHFM